MSLLLFSPSMNKPRIVNMSLARPPPRLVYKLFAGGKVMWVVIFNFNKICWFLLFFIHLFNNRGKVNNQPSTDVIQLTLTLKMTTAQVIETSATVNNSPIQDYVSLPSPGRSYSTYLVIFRQHIYWMVHQVRTTMLFLKIWCLANVLYGGAVTP